MSESQPCSTGSHLMSPERVVGLLQTFETARTFLKCLSLADVHLLPSVPGGHATVAWSAPGTPVPRAFDDERNLVGWFEEVPEYLGRIDAIMHVSPVGAHRDGDLEAAAANGTSATFRRMNEHPSARDRPMTIGVVTDDDSGLVLTDRGVWHTLLPQPIDLVPLGANLGTYLAGLAPDDEVLPYRWCLRALRHYWIGIVFVLDRRAVLHCPCGRDTMHHHPSWEDLREPRP